MPPQTNKAWRWTGILFGGFLLLIALYLAVEHIRGRVALNHYLATMRAQGEKFSIAELTPTPVPPDQNGAGLLMGAGFAVGKVAPNVVPGSMRYVAPGVAVAAAREQVWAIQKQGVFISTNGVTALWRTNNSTDTPRSSTRGSDRMPMLITHEELAEDMQAVSNALVQVRAALTYPALDHLLDYSAGFKMTFPQFSREKPAAQWLRTASLCALQETNHAAALENLTALAAFAHAATNEPLLISQLVRIAIFHIGVAAIWEAMQVDGWTEEQLRGLQAALGPADFVRAMTQALEMERAMGVEGIDRANEDANAAVMLLNQNAVGYLGVSGADTMDEVLEKLRPIFLRAVYLPIWNIAWKDQDKLRLLQHWQKQIEKSRAQMREPNWKRHSPESLVSGLPATDAPEERTRLRDSIRFPMSALLGVLAGRTTSRAVMAEAARELAVTALALRRWELAHGSGKLPATLAELVPQFLPALPVDPFDGQPLRYRRNDDGTFLLYSVGTNGKDDGGDARPITSVSQPRLLDMRDIVWPRAVTTEEGEKLNPSARRGSR